MLVPRDEATHTATVDGDWHDDSVWDTGSVPASAGDKIRIPDGTTLTLSQQEPTRYEWIRVDGTLEVDPAVDTGLRVETLVATATSTLRFGTATNPIDPDASCTVEFLDQTGEVERRDAEGTLVDPLQSRRGLMAMGEVRMHGAEKTSWETLSANPGAGDTSVELREEPQGWQAGDELITPDVEPLTEADLSLTDGEVTEISHKDEIREISSIDGTTVTFETPLDYDHVPPESDLDTYLVNTSRNLSFTSESNDPDLYGHIMIMSAGSSIRYAEITEMGRTDRKVPVSNPLWQRGESTTERHENRRARYALHFHRTGPANDIHILEGCVAVDGPSWGFVNHESSVDCIDCVSYDFDGAGFVTEHGNESGSFQGCFALRSFGSGEEVGSRKGWNNSSPTQADPPNNIDDFGHSGHGFWIHSPLVEVTGNVAAGHRAHGFIFFHRSLYEQPLDMDAGEKLDGKNDMVPDLPEELLTEEEREFGRRGDQDPTLGRFQWHERDDSVFFSQSCRLRQFENNTCFASGVGCSFRSVSHRNEQDRGIWATPKDFTAYNIGPHFLEDGSKQGQRENFESSGNVGIDHRYVGNLSHDGHRLIGTGDGVGSNVNLSYNNGFDLHNSTIENFEYGYTPKTYNEPGNNWVTNCTFDNDTDILLLSRFVDRKGGLYLDGNTYNGTNRLEWQELSPPNMHPRRFLNTEGRRDTGVQMEGRTVYHGWSKPDFVICEEGDDARLDAMMNRREEWKDALDGDDPETVIPGTTHQEFYEEYGITFYGALQDPDQAGYEQPDDFVGTTGTYGTQPFLGPASKTQPTDEIWADVRTMDRRGDVSLADAESDPALEEALEMANGDTLVTIANHSKHENPPDDERDDGVLVYRFDIDTDGPYLIYLRCQIQTENTRNTHRRVWYRINGGSWQESHQLGRFGGSGLAWLPVAVPVELTESNNSQKIEIGGFRRDLDVNADWLLINHKTVGAAPIGNGKDPTP